VRIRGAGGRLSAHRVAPATSPPAIDEQRGYIGGEDTHLAVPALAGRYAAVPGWADEPTVSATAAD
jgi:hypothetical protein